MSFFSSIRRWSTAWKVVFALAAPQAGAVPADVPRNSIARPNLIAGEIDTPRFRVLYTARSETAARRLAKEIEATRDYFGSVLSRDWPGVTEVRLGMGREEFDQMAIPGGRPPGWATALAYPPQNVILLEAGSLAEANGNAVLRHELSHVALGRLGPSWPNWFQEGLAKYLTGERSSVSEYAALFRAIWQNRIFTFDDLVHAWPDQPADVELAYAQSVAFVGFLIEQHGSAALGNLIDGVSRGDPFETGFAKAFKSSLFLEETAWRKQLPSRYSWIPLLTNASTVWAALSLVCVAAFLRLHFLRRRRRAEMEVLEEAEAAFLPPSSEPRMRLEGGSAASNDDVELPDGPWTHSGKPG